MVGRRVNQVPVAALGVWDPVTPPGPVGAQGAAEAFPQETGEAQTHRLEGLAHRLGVVDPQGEVDLDLVLRVDPVHRTDSAHRGVMDLLVGTSHLADHQVHRAHHQANLINQGPLDPHQGPQGPQGPLGPRGDPREREHSRRCLLIGRHKSWRIWYTPAQI